MESGALKPKRNPTRESGYISAAVMEWAVLCQINYVQGSSSLRFSRFFFSPDSSPCTQPSVSRSQTCRQSHATGCLPSWEHDMHTHTQNRFSVKFFIILQMSFSWFLEWALTPIGGRQTFLVFSSTKPPNIFKLLLNILSGTSWWHPVSSSYSHFLFLLKKLPLGPQ